MNAKPGPGTLIEDRYELIELLGKGGMALVFRARDHVLGRDAALKVFDSKGIGQAAYARFRREFEINGRLGHPNIVKLYHYGRLDSGQLYYLLEFIDGPSLARLLDAGRLSRDRAYRVIYELTSAVSALHENSVVHRDIKPANILIDTSTDTERTVLLDFGLARAVDETALTDTGAILGTPQYMSPELAEGREAFSTSDVFQLGLVIFEILTGRRVFRGDSLREILEDVVSKPPPRLDEYRSDIPTEWQTLIDRCLARDEQARFPNAGSLLVEVESLTGRGRALPRLQESACRMRREDHEKRDSVRREEKRPRQGGRGPARPSSSRSACLVFFCLLLLLLLIYFSNRGRARLYSVHSMRIAPRCVSCVVAWTSDSAYPGIVAVEGPLGDPASCTRVVSGNGESLLAHRLVVDGLLPGRRYRIRVIYPDHTRSLPEYIDTQSIGLDVNSGRNRDGDLVLGLKSTSFQAFSLLITCADGEKIEIARRGNGVFSIPGHVAASAIRIQAAGRLDGSCDWRVDIADHLGKTLSLMSAGLARLSVKDCLTAVHDERIASPIDGISDLARLTSPTPGDELALKRSVEKTMEQRQKLSRALDNVFRRYNTIDVFRSAARISALVLGTRIFDLEKRLLFHGGLQNHVRLLYFSWTRHARLSELSIPDMGLFSVTDRECDNPEREITIFDKTFDIGIRNLLNRGNIDSTIFFVRLDEKDLKARETRLVFSCRPFKNLGFDVTINDRLTGFLYDKPVFDPPKTCARHSVYLGVPAVLWRPGENSVKISVSDVVEPFTVESARFFRMTLRIYH